MNETIRVGDRLFEAMISGAEIREQVGRVAALIHADYAGKEPVFLCILNGSFVFAADLLRHIPLPCTVSFVKCASYAGTASTQQVRTLIGLNEDLKGKHIIIVEDIIDSGLTVARLLEDLRPLEPATVRVATCFFKKESFRMDFTIDYTGLVIPDDFVVGYGLDYDGHGRNLPGLYRIVKEKNT